MEKDSSEVPSDDAKGNLEKNRKRTVKTPGQVQALEKFYDEHKYPTEEMKLQLAESIGLTEKQVSGWFCHRRLKDKRLTSGEYATGKQDRSSGVIQDRVSGHRQDSCGSTKQGNDRNFDTREVESGRLTPKEYSAAGLTHAMPKENCNHVDDPSSGSSSSLRNMSNHQNLEPLDVAATASHARPKFPADVKGLKTRPGPSGYLKVKGRVENAAITAVKRQLGKHYREDGPPLGVDFDPLPPQAFESVMQEPVEGTYYSGAAVIPASANVKKIHQDPKFGMGYEYNSSLASHNTDGRSMKMKYGPDSYIHPKSRVRTSLSNGGACYPGSNSYVQYPEPPDRHVSGRHGGDGYGTKPGSGVEVPRLDSVPSPHLQTYSGKVRGERFYKYNDVRREAPLGGNARNDYSNFTMKNKEYCHSEDTLLSRQSIKNGGMYPDGRKAVDENQAKAPFNRNANAAKRVREEFTPPQHLKTPPMVDKLPWTDHQVMRSGAAMPLSDNEEESAETSCSVE